MKSLSQQNSRDIDELKLKLEEARQAIQKNYESSLRGEGEVKQNAIKIENLEGKMETAFQLLNNHPKDILALRNKFDDYERKNGK